MSFERKLFFSVLAGKIFLLAAFLMFFGESRFIWSDSETYVRLGRNIYAGRGFSDAHMSQTEFPPNAIRTPLYPAIVGFFDTYVPHGLVYVSLIQALAAAFIALYTYWIALRFLSHGGALVATLIASFEPLISVMHVLIMPETLLVLFLMTFLWYFLRFMDTGNTRDMVIAAVLLAAAVYTKPVALYLFIVPLFFIFFWKRVAFGFLFIGILFSLFLPWMVRNAVTLGTFDMTADDVGNICGWELVGILATQHGIDPNNFTSLYTLPEYEPVKTRCTSTGSAFWIFLTEYPASFIKTSFLSAMSLLTNDGYMSFHTESA